ncbi:MAG: hypothetical protein MR308_02255 [Lachnospiraceae bacterium]|nr:hypothetical protein [Lachnospiraceae bacterium]
MMDRMTRYYLMMQMKLKGCLEKFTKEERGASDIVAIILICVVVIAVAAIFRTQLLGAVNTVMEKLMNFVNGD